MVEFADFVPHAPVPSAIVEEYRGRVPDELVEIDLITWEPSLGVVGILFREGRTVGLGTKLRTFVMLTLMDGAAHLSRTLNWDLFPEAVAQHGEPAYEESFIFVPLLSMGGQAKIENLHKRETIASIQVAADLQGVIGH